MNRERVKAIPMPNAAEAWLRQSGRRPDAPDVLLGRTSCKLDRLDRLRG